MNQISSDDIQQIAVDAGALVLENGGETYRSEDTVVHTAQSLGADAPSSFVTPTVVMVSFRDNGGTHYSYFRRIYRRGTNLRKLVMINNLSRSLERRCRISDARMIEHRIERINNTPDYPGAVVVAAAALNSFFFTLLFGGSLTDALCAFGIGAVLRLILKLLDKSTLNSFFISLLSGSVISMLADCIGLTALPVHTSVVMIGVLMQVVPGLALVNSIRDIIAGDFMAGTARLMDVLMTALGLSVGSAAGILFTGVVKGLL
ncbi:MAG TPA: threonine/serine exporter [Treponema sp.]|nr:threonine/serine exporter [Treponema sp.]